MLVRVRLPNILQPKRIVARPTVRELPLPRLIGGRRSALIGGAARCACGDAYLVAEGYGVESQLDLGYLLVLPGDSSVASIGKGFGTSGYTGEAGLDMGGMMGM